MSEATRSAALGHAISLHSKQANTEASEVVATATAFHAFISETDAPPKATTKPATPPKAATPAATPAAKAAATAQAKATPAKVAEKPKPTPAKSLVDDEPEADAVTKDDVKGAIKALIDNNLTDDAVALLTKYGAEGVGKLDPQHYADVKTEAEGLLAAAG